MHRPVHIGLIGAGTCGTMFLAQALRTPSLHVVAIADLSIPRARAALHRARWPDDRAAAPSCARALATGDTYLTEDADAMIAADGLKIVIEATGDPARGRPPCTVVLPSRASRRHGQRRG
ncbi:MAG: hypothetical protein AUG48_11805 [Actinobacteria bacterium 13_1_20CM_3_68_9]|nr:MAG: hypothetical protein AUG48_11805 [Actinobacteria bacterium 13_1_20CM_3_68_9]